MKNNHEAKRDAAPIRVNEFGEEDFACPVPCFFDGLMCESHDGECLGVWEIVSISGVYYTRTITPACRRYQAGVPKFIRFEPRHGHWWGKLSASNTWVKLAELVER